MRYNIEIIRKLLRFFYELLFAVLMLEFVIVIFYKDSVSYKNIAVIVAFYVLSYVAREKSNNIFIMLVIHIIPIVVLCFMNIEIKYIVLYSLFMIFLADASYMYIRKGMVLLPMTDFPWVTFLMCLVIYIYGYFTKSLDMIKGIYIIPVILIFIYLFSIYADGLKKYVISTSDISGLPIRSIIITNTSIVGFVSFLLLCLIIISGRLDLTGLTSKLVLGFAAILKVIWAVISFIGAIIGSMITTGRSNLAANSSNYGEQIGAEAGHLAELMEGIMKLALIALLVYALYRLGKYILSIIFVRYRHEDGKVENVSAPVKKHIVKEKLPKRKVERLDITQRFRRMYKSYVERHIYELSLDKSTTCREIEQEMEKLEIESAHEISELYSKVRYGGVEADRKILKKMHDITR